MTRLPLARHPLGQTRDPARARELLAEHFVDHKLTAHDNADLNFHLNGLRLADSVLLAWTYGTAVRIETTALATDFAVLIPMSGSFSVQVDDEDEFSSPPLDGAVISPPSSARLDLAADCVMAAMLWPRADVEAEVRAIGTEVPGRSVRFSTRIEPGGGLGQVGLMLDQVLKEALARAERTPGNSLN